MLETDIRKVLPSLDDDKEATVDSVPHSSTEPSRMTFSHNGPHTEDLCYSRAVAKIGSCFPILSVASDTRSRLAEAYASMAKEVNNEPEKVCLAIYMTILRRT